MILIIKNILAKSALSLRLFLLQKIVGFVAEKYIFLLKVHFSYDYSYVIINFGQKYTSIQKFFGYAVEKYIIFVKF